MKKIGTRCVHKWAHNDDPYATGSNGKLRFHGNLLYSYATIIAVRYPKKKTVLIAGAGIYNSPTTSGHKWEARRAVPPDWKIVEVDVIERMGCDLPSVKRVRLCHDAMKNHLQGDLYRVAAESRKGISQHKRYEEYLYEVERCNELAKFLGRKPIVPRQLSEEDMVKAKEAKRKAEEAAVLREELHRKQRERERAERIEKERAAAELWREHKLDGRRYFDGTYLRLSPTGKQVETSRGVVVTIREAMALYLLCSKVRAVGIEPHALPELEVDRYRLSRIKANGDCEIGCHNLTWDEMDRCHMEAVRRGLLKD